MEIDEVVRIHRKNIAEEVIMEEVKAWVEEPFYSRTRKTKYFKSDETY